MVTTPTLGRVQLINVDRKNKKGEMKKKEEKVEEEEDDNVDDDKKIGYLFQEGTQSLLSSTSQTIC
ncbi:hypothetical protein BLOT_013157 [Blomia tropicalis]|nr:hypothetical protein BLOT_013157 [Blomia tropicalis]